MLPFSSELTRRNSLSLGRKITPILTVKPVGRVHRHLSTSQMEQKRFVPPTYTPSRPRYIHTLMRATVGPGCQNLPTDPLEAEIIFLIKLVSLRVSNL